MDDEYDADPELGDEVMPYHDLMELFETLSFKEKWHKFFYGFSQPKETGAYKWSRLQLVRLSAPISAVLVPCFFLALLLLFAGLQPERQRQVRVQIKDQEQIEALDDEIEFENEPIEPPEPIEIDFVPDATPSVDSPLPPSPSVEVSPSPADIDTVATIKSPVVMRGIFGSRSGGARGAALGAYGGSGITEGAVIRALRWLKKNQATDGSWPKTKPAMTALALLTFLAHGETPASEEFGPTVEKAIKYLVSTRDEAGGWPRRYQHAIVTYALCEAYALTKVPMLKDVCYDAIDILIKGQNPTGGWGYAFPDGFDDTSCMGWCAQALKAGKMAGVQHPRLKEASKLAVVGFQKNAHPSGGFGYRTPGRGGLSGVGVLCMQLLGASKKAECQNGLNYLDPWTYSWENPQGKSPVYYWYYITQAKFHSGERWDAWNKVFSNVLVKNQQIIKDAIKDTKGNLKDIGFWDSPAEHEHSDGRVMDTCLCALQLQVYYRYLPTFKPPKDEENEVDFAEDSGDIEIEIDI